MRTITYNVKFAITGYYTTEIEVSSNDDLDDILDDLAESIDVGEITDFSDAEVVDVLRIL